MEIHIPILLIHIVEWIAITAGIVLACFGVVFLWYLKGLYE